MNWQQIVNDLLSTGLTQGELGGKVGCPQSTISDIASGKRGKRPSWSVGSALVELHKDICPAAQNAS